jgi:hypothetical protein
MDCLEPALYSLPSKIGTLGWLLVNKMATGAMLFVLIVDRFIAAIHTVRNGVYLGPSASGEAINDSYGADGWAAQIVEDQLIGPLVKPAQCDTIFSPVRTP